MKQKQQQQLPFPETPHPCKTVWTQLSDGQQQLAIAVLARLIAATQSTDKQTQESYNDE